MSRPWVLVTGCSTGMGRALVGVCREAGWGVVATARRLETLAELPDGEDLRRLALDVTSDVQIAEVVAACAGLRLVALINNAGYGLAGPLELLRPGELRAQFETNVVGLQALTNACLPLIRANAAPGEGRVVHVASMLGRVSIPLMGAYNASKHAVVALAETLRMELHPRIKVILVEPGAVLTEFRDTSVRGLGDLPERAKDTPYAGMLARSIAKRLQMGDTFGCSPEAAARRILPALTRRNPPRRIPIRPEATWVRMLRAILPMALFEWAMRRTYGLD
jgi:short-subunit dehydrogenase